MKIVWFYIHKNKVINLYILLGILNVIGLDKTYYYSTDTRTMKDLIREYVRGHSTKIDGFMKGLETLDVNQFMWNVIKPTQQHDLPPDWYDTVGKALEQVNKGLGG